jgi:hypothetical protein
MLYTYRAIIFSDSRLVLFREIPGVLVGALMSMHNNNHLSGNKG